MGRGSAARVARCATATLDPDLSLPAGSGSGGHGRAGLIRAFLLTREAAHTAYPLRGSRGNRHHRGGHSRKNARPRRIEDRALAYGQRAPRLDDLADRDHPIRLRGLEEVDLELDGQHFSIGRHDRQRGIAAGDVDETRHDAPVKQPVLLCQRFIEAATSLIGSSITPLGCPFERIS